MSQNCHVHTQTFADCAFQVNITDILLDARKWRNVENYNNEWQNTPKKYHRRYVIMSKQCRQVSKSIFSGFQKFCHLDMFVIFIEYSTLLCTLKLFILRFYVRINETM